MTFLIHKSNQRGSFKNEWLDTKYSFSFSNYYNPSRVGFGKLKVLNDDIVSPGNGFGLHPHNNMEIITLVVKGELTHKDNMGNTGVINAGDVQVMSAGKGVVHSEFNNSLKERVELFQIWIDTAKKNIPPRYDQKKMNWANEAPRVLVSGIKEPNTLFINQDAKVIAGKLKREGRYIHKLEKKRGVFIMCIEGELEINGQRLSKRDSVEITNEEDIWVVSKRDSLILVIDVLK